MTMTITDIYADIDDLILLLKNNSHRELAEQMEHRMYKVSWTSGSELLECIEDILRENLNSENKSFEAKVANKMKEVLGKITSGGYTS